jgi:hypothetical protein
MNRRLFIQSVCATTAVCATVAREAVANTGQAGAHTMFTLYDPRFPNSRAQAELLAPHTTLRAIAGDVSNLVPIIGSTPLDIAGVTTESVPFCLEQLMSVAHRPVLSMRRLDADLFAWTLKSHT